MPLQATSGAASYDAFGGGVPVVPNYIEDVFSTYLYTGNGGMQTIANGIELGQSYGGSVYFGSGNYISAASNAAFEMGGGDFTVEAWVYPNASYTTYNYIVGIAATNGLVFYVTGGNLVVRSFNGSDLLSSSTIPALNAWTHVAATRSGTTLRIFVNGVQTASTTNSTSFNVGVANIGNDGSNAAPWLGSISNFRLVKGTAVYTSNFTPSTIPLTAISGTSLLTCRTPNTILDYSSNSFTITTTGSPTPQNGGGPFTDSTAGKGGLVWIKGRNNSWSHILQDTNRGVNSSLTTNNTEKAVDSTGIYVTSFNSNGFSIGPNGPVNFNTNTYVSWAFRKQPKFYTQGTYTGTGSVQNITHDLGSIPAFIIVKDTTNDGSAWAIYHTSLGNTKFLQFTTDAAGTSSGYWNNTSPTSTQFTVGTNGNVNQSGATFVYYAFAHNAGGFGLTGTDNVISCGSVSATGSTLAEVNLGYEPQWLLIKGSNITNGWSIIDNMRGFTADSGVSWLQPNTSAAEVTSPTTPSVYLTSTGFKVNSNESPLNGTGTYIYIAIRRGPMKVPTSGTSVLGLNARTGTGAVATVTGSAGVSDAVIVKNRGSAVASLFSSRLTGTGYLVTSARDAEVAAGATILQSNPWDVMDGVKVGTTSTITNASGSTFINYLFKRAPSVFDEICYTGNGVAGRTLNHNLGVAPELVIIKSRSLAEFWPVITTALQLVLLLDDLGGGSASVRFYLGNNTIYIAPTSTTLTIATDTSINSSGATYVAYLFATCAGVSKVGSYTGNGSSQTINCGFTGGARFVLIKRTDTDGDWYVWDSARGIVAGNDPHLSLNTTAAEVTTDDSVDTDNTGFIVNQVSATNVNVSSATYIFLAIA